MKKIYIFLRLKDAFNKIIDHPSVYAITSNNDHMKRFTKERDMNVFKTITCKLDNDFYKQFYNKYYKYELREQMMYTRLSENDNGTISHIKVLSTDYELEIAITHKSVLHELCKFVSYRNIVLKKKYMDALTELYYFSILRYAGIYECFPSEDEFSIGFNSYPYYRETIPHDLEYVNLDELKNILNDEYAIFMYVHASTFK